MSVRQRLLGPNFHHFLACAFRAHACSRQYYDAVVAPARPVLERHARPRNRSTAFALGPKKPRLDNFSPRNQKLEKSEVGMHSAGRRACSKRPKLQKHETRGFQVASGIDGRLQAHSFRRRSDDSMHPIHAYMASTIKQ